MATAAMTPTTVTATTEFDSIEDIPTDTESMEDVVEEELEAEKPEPVEVAAAVGYDTSAQKLIVVAGAKRLSGAQKDSVLDVSGRQITLLELCSSVEEAKAACEERANNIQNLQSLGLSHIAFQETNEDGTPRVESTDGSLTGLDDITLNDLTAMEEAASSSTPFVKHVFNEGCTSEVHEDFQQQLNNSNESIRELITYMMNDIKSDITAVMNKQERLASFLNEKFNIGADGILLPPVVSRVREHNFNTLNDCGPVFRQEEESRKRKLPLFAQLLSKYNQPAAVKRQRIGNSPSERPAGGEKIGQAGEYLTYPFINQEQEEDCFNTSGGSPSAYANLLARLLFTNSLDLYFKDQDPRKRQWLHEAVDFRYPSADKHAQIMKWKSCSYAINRNMKNPQPLPAKTYTPVAKPDPPKPETPQSMPVSYSMASKFANQDFLSTKTSQPPINYKHLPESFELDCLEKARGNPVRYTELMALRLFAKTLGQFFKEQDIVKKEWLRMCVERRFPIDDKNMRDQRWKVCAQACNKNRSKVLDADGNEADYPYVSKEVETECFEASNGVPYVYAELMARKLFPDTPHLLFKDQDDGRRHWLHRNVEKRFPTDNPVERMAKWKSCTTAMNKRVVEYHASKDKVIKVEEKEVKKEEKSKPSSSSISRSATPKNEKRSVLENCTATNTPTTATPADKKTAASTGTTAATSSTSTTTTKRESVRNKVKKELKETYTEYPYVSEEEELTILDQASGNVQVYAKNLAKILFKETLKMYLKDQDPEKRQWMREIVDFRFPTKTTTEYRQQWKNISAVVNKNMTTPAATASTNSTPTTSSKKK